MKGTNSFTVETHILSQRLSDQHLEAFFKEDVDRLSISAEVTSGETLVGAIEEWEQLLSLYELSKDSPLFGSGVNTSWVVSADVEKDDRAWLGGFEGLAHAIEVKHLSFGVKVRVFLVGKASFFDNGEMVSPGGVRVVNFTGSEVSKEFETDSEGTSSGKGLDSHDLVVL